MGKREISLLYDDRAKVVLDVPSDAWEALDDESALKRRITSDTIPGLLALKEFVGCRRAAVTNNHHTKRHHAVFPRKNLPFVL